MLRARPAERAVASLVADGLIFAQLNLASRAQLAAEVTRHQEPPPALTYGLKTDP